MKTSALLPALLSLAATSLLLAGTPAAPGHACCPTVEAGAFSRDSLYQLEHGFRDDTGAPQSLGDLRGQPVLLTMFFGSCTTACPALLSDLARIRAALPAEVRARVRLVLVSFDSVRDTPDALRAFRASRALDDQWTLLSAAPDAVAELAAALGVKYTLQADGQYAHSNLVTVLNAQGEITHQRAGLQTPIEQTVSALVSAANAAR